MRARAVAACVAACVVGFGAFGILSADAANPAGFTAVVNALSQLPAGGLLEGVSCASAGQCAVVGQDIGNQPVALAGDPSSWALAQMRQITLGSAFGPDDIFGSDLSDVTCTSSTACVAVGNDGNDQPLMLVGNPATWGPTQAREIALGSSFGDFGSGLSSISCTSASACVAVGDDGNFQPLVFVGNPSTWGPAQAREIKLGSSFGIGALLRSVTCTSSSSCVAVGVDVHETQSDPFFNDMPFVLVGNPATWTSAQAHELTLGSAFGSGGSLSSVACVSASSCVAVGGDDNHQPLVLSGNPSSWGVAQAYELTLGSGFGSSGFLTSVTCTSSSSCVAVGGDKNQPLALVGDPSTTWSAAQAQEIALGAGFSSGGWLNAISCSSPSACTATGADGNTMPLVLNGDPSTWGAAQAQNFNLTGMGFGVASLPSALTCVSTTSCLELGSYGNAFQQRTYLLRGNPGTWNQAGETTLTGISPYSSLNGGTCPAANFCVAVGQDGNTGGLLVLAGDPSTFATAPGKVLPLGSAFGSSGLLTSVACASTTSCVAVGYDSNGEPVVLTGNPATWTSASVKELKLSSKFHSRGFLFSVTCSSATACVAVGVDGGLEPLVFSGNPSSWTASSAKRIKLTSALGSTGEFYSVACTSSTYCVAVGTSGKASKPLVVAGNPAHWTPKQAFNLKIAHATASTAAGFGAAITESDNGQEWSVSCDKRAYCVAIGGDKQAAPVYIAGNPKKWKGHSLVRPARNGASFVTADLTTTGCTTNKCFAAGKANGGDFVASFSGG